MSKIQLVSGFGRTQLEFSVIESLKECPLYIKKELSGIRVNIRDEFIVKDVIIVDEKGVSLNSRQIAIHTKNNITWDYLGVLYDKKPIVLWRRPDGKLQLISGFNRMAMLLKRGQIKFFADIVEFEDDAAKFISTIAFNCSDDHLSGGIPPTDRTIVKVLHEAVIDKSFDHTGPNGNVELRRVINEMTLNKYSPDHVEKIVTKFRKTHHIEQSVEAYDTPKANTLLESLGLPYGGDKAIKQTGRLGFALPNITHTKVAQWVDYYEKHLMKTIIEIYTFIDDISPDNVKNQRKQQKIQYEETINWLKSHYKDKFHNIVMHGGCIAQINSKNPKDGGKRLERGIVDWNGNIIIDTPNKA